MKNSIFMECNDEYTIISKDSIEKIQTFNNKQLTWYKLTNGYIGSHAVINNNDTILYLHQHLMNYYGNGLDKNAKLKDSGIEWLGEIPASWDMVKFTWLTEFITCGLAATPKYVEDII